jgi:transcriptional regulator with XRE-family HTH domain
MVQQRRRKQMDAPIEQNPKTKQLAEPPELNSLAERLNYARRCRGLAQAAVAVACEVSRAAVSQWERGDTQPGDEFLERAAELLAVRPEWLRAGADPQPDLQLPSNRFNEPAKPRGRKPKPWEPAIVAPAVVMPIPPAADMIPELAMGIGEGPLLLDGRVQDWWKLPAGFVRETLRSEPRHLLMLRVRNDAMTPTIKRGDFVLIDRSQTQPIHDEIFAIDNGLGIMLRRILIGNGALVLRADSDPTQDFRIEPGELNIAGRRLAAIII